MFKAIQSENIDLFFHVIEVVLQLFPKETTGNINLINMIIQVMDPENVRFLNNTITYVQLATSQHITPNLKYLVKIPY